MFLTFLLFFQLTAFGETQIFPTFKISELTKTSPQTITSSPFSERLKGKITVVDLWASWCEPCAGLMTEYQTLADELSKYPHFQILTVTVDEDKDDALKFIEKNKVQLPVFHDPNKTIPTALGIQILPSTLLVNSDGTLIGRFSGAKKGHTERLRKTILEALSRSTPNTPVKGAL